MTASNHSTAVGRIIGGATLSAMALATLAACIASPGAHAQSFVGQPFEVYNADPARAPRYIPSGEPSSSRNTAGVNQSAQGQPAQNYRMPISSQRSDPAPLPSASGARLDSSAASGGPMPGPYIPKTPRPAPVVTVDQPSGNTGSETPRAVATGGSGACPAGMVQLPVSMSGSCVSVDSAYVTSGRYEQDLQAAQQNLPELIRRGQTQPAPTAPVAVAPVPQPAQVGPITGPILKPGPATEPSVATKPSSGVGVGGGSSYTGGEDHAGNGTPSNVETGTLENGNNYAFVRDTTKSSNPTYRAGDYYLGGKEAMMPSRDSISSSFGQGEDLGTINTQVKLNGGGTADCTYDVTAIDGVAGAAADAVGACKTADGKTFQSSGIVYRNYDGSWQFHAGLGSKDPGNPFETVSERGGIDTGDGGIKVTVHNSMRTIGGGTGQADVVNPYGNNVGVTDRREIVAANGDRCALAINPWSSDSQTVGATCTTPSGQTYRLEGQSYQDSLLAKGKGGTYFEFDGHDATGAYVRYVGTYDDATKQMTLLSGQSVGRVNDLPDTPVAIPVASASVAPASAAAPQVASISQVAPAPVASASPPSQALAAAPAPDATPQQTASGGGDLRGKPACAPGETLVGAGFWDDPYTCVNRGSGGFDGGA